MQHSGITAMEWLPHQKNAFAEKMKRKRQAAAKKASCKMPLAHYAYRKTDEELKFEKERAAAKLPQYMIDEIWAKKRADAAAAQKVKDAATALRRDNYKKAFEAEVQARTAAGNA